MAEVPDIRRRLPMGGQGVLDADIAEYITAWTFQVQTAAGTTPAASSMAEAVIRLGATGDARIQLDSLSGYGESPVGTAQIERAQALLERLDTITSAPDEAVEPDEPQVYGDLVQNLTMEPLWPTTEPYTPPPGVWYPR